MTKRTRSRGREKTKKTTRKMTKQQHVNRNGCGFVCDLFVCFIPNI